jgi:hypothetical protein
MNALHPIALAMLLFAATGCGPSAEREDEGLYGSSSGPNPNLADVQPEQPPEDRPPADPATAGENTYPSQTGLPDEPSTGAESGRGSAETGATDN